MPQLPAHPASFDWTVVAIFAIVYLGMFLGGLPRLKLDRAGIALLGAIAVIGSGAMSPESAAQAVHLPTVLLLFAFMVMSAQMRLGGFYTAVTRAVAALPLAPAAWLAALIAVVAGLSAVFSNDIVCLAVTPVLVRICLQRSLNPLPFLVGLACAANIGSAATLIGNPQNMLIGAVARLSFVDYIVAALPPVLLSLLALWLWLARAYRLGLLAERQTPVDLAADDAPAFDRWQSAKGLAVAALVMLAFLFTDWPREVVALVAAGVLLLSRRLHSAQVMGFVDWPLLVLFAGLFVVNGAFERTGLAADAVHWLAEHGVALDAPGPLLVIGVGLSNLVSNVPAVMLLLPHLHSSEAATLLALASTFAGNLLLVGSIANLIVADLARRTGVEIDWKQHARIGIPVTLMSLAVLAGTQALLR